VPRSQRALTVNILCLLSTILWWLKNVFINPLPSDRPHCCNWYIRCQPSLAVMPLNSRPATPASLSHREVCVRWAGISLPKYNIGLQLLGVSKLLHVRCQLTQWDVPDCDGPGGVGLWTVTHMCSITHTDATSHNRTIRCALKTLSVYKSSLGSSTASYRKTPVQQPFWILIQQEMIGWQWGRLNHMLIICTSLQTDNHASMSSSNFLQAGCSLYVT